VSADPTALNRRTRKSLTKHLDTQSFVVNHNRHGKSLLADASLWFSTTLNDTRRTRCLICPWYQCCIGCLIPDDDTPNHRLWDGDSIVVDWHFAVDVATSSFGLRTTLRIRSEPAVAVSGSIPAICQKNPPFVWQGDEGGHAVR
jgi:hypothetical protein